ncbi:competence type IV pilus major pilin ComGC [Bacillus taeanensis]|uniref:Competence protein ComG n=1 Tax=Bacillus taeanensis TaxID=273032 RepID=A0A366XXF1_9BACI|nr:competence type IV pilus major pilin ComGC [Bacillus taeanensis]RBW70577.1 competence protein ComG [Bacillus taeanensis]
MKCKNEKGFTLIEMMIVIMIISVLLLIVVPSMSKNNSVVKEKSCDATVKVVQAQTTAYEAELGAPASTIDDLVTANYLNPEEVTIEGTALVCPDNRTITISEGSVVVSEPTTP